MYNSIFASKDNTIYNVKINGQIVSSSNAGQSEVLELMHLTSSLLYKGDSRILLYFDVSAHSQSIAAGDIPSSSVQYTLTLKDAPHADITPYSYDVSVLPLSRTWDEGRGLSNYDMGLKDRNQYSNWAYATSIQPWTSPGADMITSANLTASQHFDFGTEDLSVDISNIVYAWLTGGLVNNGIAVKYFDSYESSSVDYAWKRFFARNAKMPERRPIIAAKWNKIIQDDRTNVSFGISSSLFYYRYINGVYDNLSTVYCSIVNSSGSVIQTLTASRPQGTNGIHQVSGVLIPFNTGSFICNDIWFNGATQYFTGTISVNYSTGSSNPKLDDLVVVLTNIKSFYQQGEKVAIRAFVREKDYAPAVVSYATTTPKPLFTKNVYYEISNSKTNAVIVPFSTGSLEFSKLSYDDKGHYFEIWTDSLPQDNIYKIKILVQYNGEKIVFDNNWILNVK